jgi:hypothetical protein
MFEMKSLNSPEEVRTFDKGKVELVKIAGATIGRATFEPGWKWSTCVKPLANTNSCQMAHYGYQLSGKLTTRMDDGTELVDPEKVILRHIEVEYCGLGRLAV